MAPRVVRVKSPHYDVEVKEHRFPVTQSGGRGPAGAVGVGIPVGGVTGQTLVKKSVTNYDTEWRTGTGTDVDRVVRTLTAGTAISALRGIRALDEEGIYCDAATAGDAGTCVGISVLAADLGDPVTIVVSGTLSDVSWNWTPGPIFLGADGALTQTPPTTPTLEFSQVVAVAVLPTEISVAIQPPVILV